MQSRRNKDPTMGHAHNLYDMPGRDFDGRSLSPRNVEGSRRLLGVDGRNSSVERRGFGRGFDGAGGDGGRGERVRSRSPPFGLMRERRGYDDEVFPRRDFPNAELRQRYEFVDRIDLDADLNTGLKHECGHEARLVREEEFGDTSRLVGRKFLASEEMFKLPQDLGTTSRYAEGGGGFSSSVVNMNTVQFKDERARYPDPLVDKVPRQESYREREKPMFHSRDVRYPDVPMSQSTDHMSLSSGISRAYFQGSYQDDLPLVTDSRKSAKFTEPLGISSYVQRSSLESGRDHALENEDFPRYWQDKLSLTRAERQDYLNPRTREGDSDIYGPSSDNLHRRMGTHDRLDYDHEDWSRPVTRDPIQDGLDDSEYTSRLEKDRIFLDHPSIKKQKVPDYLDVDASKGQEYFDYRSAHVEYGRVSREREMPQLGVSKDHKISHLRSNFGFGRDVGSTSHGERTRNLPKFEYDQSYEIEAEGHEIYDSSDRARRRKYNPDAEMSGHNSRGIILDKRYSNNRVQYLDDRNEEWSGQDSGTKFFSRSGAYDNKRYSREEREFFGEDHPGFSESEEWLPSDDCVEHVQAYSIKPHKSGAKHAKGYLRHGQQSSRISSRLDRRHVPPKWRNVWIRGQEDNQVDKHENEVDQSDNWMSSSKPEPQERSEEHKQSVQKAFLIFSKKLNDNSGVRKRYKEQGRAGSLFCIVCGRSVSKEFRDTQRLATHAFMSHKLRAEHLGLHKAICVLLGWKSEVAPDVITWVPEHIPHKEATAQKEDVIIWPPVVIIHNSSIEGNKVDEQQVISLEAVGNFLRGKGFSGGKFKTCLGKPGNHSVIVVRFLGTFSGLQDAERLHKYFVDNKRGRVDFWQGGHISSKSSSSNEVAGQNNLELMLYGYMGISEDLDEVNIDIKKKCWIKSKREIHDLENAPVKPD